MLESRCAMITKRATPLDARPMITKKATLDARPTVRRGARSILVLR